MHDREFFIIEHPRRGTLREFEWPAWEEKPVARWSTSGMRSDPDKTRIFYSLRTAIADFDSLPPKIQEEAAILRPPKDNERDYVKVYPEGL